MLLIFAHRFCDIERTRVFDSRAIGVIHRH